MIEQLNIVDEYKKLLSFKNSFKEFTLEIDGREYEVPSKENRYVTRRQMMLYMIWKCLFTHNSTEVILMDKYASTILVIEEALEILGKFKWMSECVVYRQRRLLKFKNGSVLLPTMQYQTLKGLTISDVAIDENLPDYDDALIHIMPAVARYDGGVVMVY